MVHQPLGGGKDHVGSQGQVALPLGWSVQPVLGAVIYQPLMGDGVQQMDLLRGSAPEQGLPKAMHIHQLKNMAGQLAVPDKPEQPLILGGLRSRRESVYGQAGAYFAAGLAVVPGRRLQKDDLGILQPGHQLLGAGGDSAPGLGGEAQDLFQRDTPSKSRRAVSWLRSSTCRSRSTPPDRNSVSPIRA